jgi:hypothetical protein
MELGAASGTLLIDTVASVLRNRDYRLKSITVVGIEGVEIALGIWSSCYG